MRTGPQRRQFESTKQNSILQQKGVHGAPKLANQLTCYNILPLSRQTVSGFTVLRATRTTAIQLAKTGRTAKPSHYFKTTVYKT
jgi:hypothetical protein